MTSTWRRRPTGRYGWWMGGWWRTERRAAAPDRRERATRSRVPPPPRDGGERSWGAPAQRSLNLPPPISSRGRVHAIVVDDGLGSVLPAVGQEALQRGNDRRRA